MEEELKIIASACLKHSDSGEQSFNKEARVIVQALKENGYVISKEADQGIILPEPIEDENFIEQEISYQYHGVVRGAIVNYKIWLRQRMVKKI